MADRKYWFEVPSGGTKSLSQPQAVKLLAKLLMTKAGELTPMTEAAILMAIASIQVQAKLEKMAK